MPQLMINAHQGSTTRKVPVLITLTQDAELEDLETAHVGPAAGGHAHQGEHKRHQPGIVHLQPICFCIYT